jgi:hypothetical protein
MDEKSEEPWTSETTPVHPRMQPLFEYLKFNKRILDVENDPDIMGIFSREALELIRTGKPGWEEMVPDFVDRIIKKKRLFGYSGKADKAISSSEDIAAAAARAISQESND